MKKAAKSHASPEAVARAVADGYAAAVQFPNTLIPQDAPVGIIAQHMVEGRFDKAFLVSEIERFTGVKLDIPGKPGRSCLSSHNTDTGAPN